MRRLGVAVCDDRCKEIAPGEEVLYDYGEQDPLIVAAGNEWLEAS